MRVGRGLRGGGEGLSGVAGQWRHHSGSSEDRIRSTAERGVVAHRHSGHVLTDILQLYGAASL